MAKNRKFVPPQIKQAKQIKRKRGELLNRDTHSVSQMKRGIEIFEELKKEDQRKASNLDIVAEAIAKKGNMTSSRAYSIANKLTLLERMKRAQK
jgi:hypothetical protein